MCCCHVDQCCCGCTDQKTGVMVWAIIDMVLNIGTVIFYGATVGIVGPQLWTILIILADFLLIFGAWKLNTGLMMIWQIIMMIQIVLLFICWLAVPIMVRRITNFIYHPNLTDFPKNFRSCIIPKSNYSIALTI